MSDCRGWDIGQYVEGKAAELPGSQNNDSYITPEGGGLKLSKDGKEELALALLLWKDFKCQGKVDLDFYKQMIAFADGLGVRVELEELMRKVLAPFKITLD